MYLNTHSYYSLRYGTLSPRQLVAEAVKRGITTLALTDINNTSCSYTFQQACRAANIKPVLGVEFRRDHQLLYIGLAKNDLGFFELNQLLTRCSMEGSPLPDQPPSFSHAYVIYPTGKRFPADLEAHEFIGIRPEEVPGLYSHPLRKHLDKLVAWSPVTFLDHDGFRVHKLLRAIDLNTIVTKLKRSDCARETELFCTPDELRDAYKNYPQLIANSQALLDHCQAEIPSQLTNNRQTFTGDKKGDFQLLCKLARIGLQRRYGDHHPTASERLEKELEVIWQLGFCCYFLITWDIIRYAQSVGYHYVGRGSGANSIVAYCLLITDVEPLELDLYFERFINQFRSSPPDFDIDFSWKDRDDVIDYIFKRYGKTHTAQLATYNTFKLRSIIRELGKVFGLPKAEIDLLINEPEATDRHHGLARHIFYFGKMIAGFPNYLSIHAGGIIISERPLNYFSALQMMPKGFPIAHFDMYGAEDLQFHKYDVLSQRGLGHIKEAVSLVYQNRKKRVDVRDVEGIKNDPLVKKQLKAGKCIGCFYIESPAMRGLLTKLGCDNYVHLVAASSIIRPGVAKSGMMREYIRRFHQTENIKYLNPVFEKHLKETFGVMVYQEDVMKIVHHFAGLALDESDVLRRIMTGKKKSSDAFEKLKQKYFTNCKARGYDQQLTDEVWRQIESFSGYSFCKAHSASFAVESFQSLFLKAYYPLEFMVAVINNFGGFYRTEYYFHEARMQGGTLHAPCVNKSSLFTNIEQTDIFIGFIHLHQMERALAEQIVQERRRQGVYRSLEDFIRRVQPGSEQLDLLIRIDAFRFTEKNKYELMWEKNNVFQPRQTTDGLLFNEDEHFCLPELKIKKHDHAFDQIELLGFPLCAPFNLLEEKPGDTIAAMDMKKQVGKTVQMLGYFVTRKEVRTVNDKRMNFGTWLDEAGHYFDSVHFPPCLRKYPLRGGGCYLLHGKIVLDFDFPSLEVIAMKKLAFVQDERY